MKTGAGTATSVADRAVGAATEAVPSTTHDGTQRRARSSRIVVALLIVAGVGLRGWLLASPYGALNADEAVTGIVGSGAAHGRFPIIFGGSVYGGTIDGYLAAPFLRLWPGNYLVLKIVTTVLWVAIAAGIGVLVRGTIGSTVGNSAAWLAGAYVWVFSWSMLTLSTTAYTGYASGLLLTVVAAIAISKGIGATRSNTNILAGVCTGLALWCHPLYVVCLAPLIVASTWLHRAELWAWLIRIGVGTIAGLSPFLFWNARHGWASRTQPPPLIETTFAKRFHNVVSELLPRGFGLRTSSGWWIMGRVGMAVWWLAIAAGFAGFVLLIRRGGFSMVMGVVGVVSVPFLAMFNALFFFQDGRYFAMILLPWVCGLVAAVHALTARFRRPAALAALIGLAAAVGCLPWFRSEVPRRFLDPEHGTQAMAARLRAAGIAGVKGEYWLVNRVSFVTDEHIAAAVTAGPERFGSLAARVAALPNDKVAYLYYAGRERPNELPPDVAFDKVAIAEATLFLPRAATP